MGLSTSFGALALSLGLVGFANGVLDVSMNVHGLAVERHLKRPILATLHAAFSFGALAGAAFGGAVAAAGVGVEEHLTSAAVLGALV
ncbi:MAG: MFS transporter, partial [Thermoleophilaceae bacterium]|nr:MFS transporter [Thermoleophilaceae bacterium]